MHTQLRMCGPRRALLIPIVLAYRANCLCCAEQHGNAKCVHEQKAAARWPAFAGNYDVCCRPTLACCGPRWGQHRLCPNKGAAVLAMLLPARKATAPKPHHRQTPRFAERLPRLRTTVGNTKKTVHEQTHWRGRHAVGTAKEGARANAMASWYEVCATRCAGSMCSCCRQRLHGRRGEKRWCPNKGGGMSCHDGKHTMVSEQGPWQSVMWLQISLSWCACQRWASTRRCTNKNDGTLSCSTRHPDMRCRPAVACRPLWETRRVTEQRRRDSHDAYVSTQGKGAQTYGNIRHVCVQIAPSRLRTTQGRIKQKTVPERMHMCGKPPWRQRKVFEQRR